MDQRAVHLGPTWQALCGEKLQGLVLALAFPPGREALGRSPCRPSRQRRPAGVFRGAGGCAPGQRQGRPATYCRTARAAPRSWRAGARGRRRAPGLAWGPQPPSHGGDVPAHSLLKTESTGCKHIGGQGARRKRRQADGCAAQRARLFRFPQNPSNVQFMPHRSHTRLTECAQEVFILHEMGPPRCAS